MMIGTMRVTDATTLRNIIDATPASIQIIDGDGRYLDCNAATYALFRARSTEDILGKTPSLLSPHRQSGGRDSNEDVALYIQKALGGEEFTFEWEHQRLDGTVFPCMVTLKRIEYLGNICLMATIVDSTEVVALRAKSEYIIANAPIPIIEVNPDLSIQNVNPAFAALIDTPLDEINAMKISDFDVRNRVGGSLTEGIETKRTVHGQIDAHVKSGVKHLQYYYTPFFDADGNLLSIFAYYIDKTAEISAGRDIIQVTERSQIGDLDVRVDPARYTGELKLLMEGMNGTLDAVGQPLHDACAVLERMAINDHTRGMDESRYQGEFARLASSINMVRDRVNHIAGSIEKISHGDLSELDEYRKIGRRSEQDRIVPGFIKAIESLQALTADTTMLVEAATHENFAARADVSRHEGEYRLIIEGINKTVELIADKVAWHGSILDAVQFPIHVTDMNMNWTYMNKAFEDVLLKNKVIKDRKSAYGLPCHTANATICKTEKCGIHQLKTKGVTESYFEWQGMNGKQVTKPVFNAKGEQVGFVETVQDLTEQLNQIAYYESILDAVPMAITVTDLNSRWTFVNKAVEKMLKKSRKELLGHPCHEWGANICNTENCGINRLKRGMFNTRFEQDGGYYNVDCAYVYDVHGEKVGHVEVVGDVTAITKVQKYLDESVRNISYCLDQFARGMTDFEVRVPEADQHTTDVRAQMVDLANNLHKARDSVRNLVVEANNLVQAALRGDLKHRADASKLLGDFADVVDGVNKTLETVGIPLNAAAKWIEDVAKGRDVFDITDEYPGDYAIIKNNINESNRMLKALVAETQRLAKGATAGDLNIRSDLTQYPGAWREIVAGFNDTLESVVTPVHEAIRVANEYAKANFAARVDPSLKVAGEWVGFKQALDNIGIRICEAIGLINKQCLSWRRMQRKRPQVLRRCLPGPNRSRRMQGV
jgi:methyl-accepting chemotaxis protein